MENTVAIDLDHLKILNSFQLVTGHNTLYLTAKCKEWFSEYRSIPDAELEQIIVNAIYFLLSE